MIRSRFNDQHPEAALTLRQVGWDDPTAGLAEGSSDVAMSDRHPLAGREVMDFEELVNEPFLALPRSAGGLREYWLATAHRSGRDPVIGAEISSTDETYEALVDGRGICLLARGNAPSVAREGVVIRPVRGLPPCELALAWRVDRPQPLVRDYVACAVSVTHSSD